MKTSQQAEVQANKVLDRFWDGRGFPVDPVIIARAMGLGVVETSLPDHVSGALIKRRGRDPVIAVEATDSGNRKRFTCAHELGHYIHRGLVNIHSYDDGEEYNFIDLRDPKASEGRYPDEMFANAFAASLLMPADEVRRRAAGNTEAWVLAQYFGVSLEAISIRLSTLGLREPAMYRG